MTRNPDTLSFGSALLIDHLSQAVDCVRALGAEFETLSHQLSGLHERLIQGRFHLAVLGQFKRGKSTLLNALLGEEVLPTAVVPLTAIPTFIRYGQECRATVFFIENQKPQVSATGDANEINAFLSKFVTEQGNSQNHLNVSYVEITHPAEILNKGVVLIDTPGIGSTFRHNTEATLNFLPQCDAALFIVSSDPPITEVEVEFLQKAQEKISRLFFILNKVDYLTDEDRRIAVDFLQAVLVKQAGMEADVPVLCVSAKEALNARLADDSNGWSHSGLAEVEQLLIQFLAHEKSETLSEAVKRKTVDILAEVVMRLELEKRSLLIPLEDLQRRMEVFEHKIEEVKQQRVSAADLLAGDKKRTFSYLEEQAERLRVEAKDYLEGVIKGALVSSSGETITDEEARIILADAIPGYFEHQRGVITDLMRERTTKVLSIHQDRTDQLIEFVRKTAADLFEVTYHAPESEKAFQMVDKPYWVTQKWSFLLTDIPEGIIDWILPSKIRKQRVMKRIYAQINDLVLNNVENLRWTTYQSINEAFRRFGSTLDERLTDTLAATHGAVHAAMEQRKKHSNSVSQELSRLESAINELIGLQENLGNSG